MCKRELFYLLGVTLATAALPLAGQVVDVTLTLDANPVNLSQTTTLRVYAQVVPQEQTNVNRIFSWYVDLLNTNDLAAAADYASLLKPASDNDPLTSSSGFEDGAHRRGIYDTFLNLPGAGVSNAVELLSVPVTALSAGSTRFQVQAGSGVPHLSADFLVAPLDESNPLVGGDYSQAWVDLEVVAACQIQLQIQRVPGPVPEQYNLSFDLCPGYNHTVEYSDQLAPNDLWQALPGAPHNTGTVLVTNTTPTRFFRVRAELP